MTIIVSIAGVSCNDKNDEPFNPPPGGTNPNPWVFETNFLYSLEKPLVFTDAEAIGIYIAPGLSPINPDYSELWYYNLEQKNYQQKTSFPVEPPMYPASFSLGGNAYIVGGQTNNEENVWRYSFAADDWFEMSQFDGNPPVDATAFVVNNEAFLVTGYYPNGGMNLLSHKYIAAADDWVEIAAFVGPARKGAVSFAIGDYAYVGTGIDDEGIGNIAYKDFYKYHPGSNSWTKIADIPSVARHHAIAFTHNGKGYVGSGQTKDGTDLVDFYSYNPENDTWTKLNYNLQEYHTFGFGITVADSAFIGLGLSPDENHSKSIWQFLPE